jgi:hypothetical protein
VERLTKSYGRNVLTTSAVRFSYWILFVIISWFWLVNLRPTQDDYALRLDIRHLGYSESLVKIWTQYSGKFSSVVPSYLANVIGFKPFPYFGLIVISAVSFVMVYFFFMGLLKSFPPEIYGGRGKARILSSTLAALSFNSLLTPGLIAPFGFVAASTTHLWPMVIAGIFYLNRTKISIWVALFTGFFIANANITEGITITFLWIVGTYRSYLLRQMEMVKVFGSAALGGLVGCSVIFLSPGFAIRSQDVGTAHLTTSAIFQHIPGTAFAVLGDYITHPIFLLGFTLAFFFKLDVRMYIRSRLKYKFALFTIFYLLITIAADSLAYTSWYHLTGIYILSFPTGLTTGLWAKNKLGESSRKLEKFLLPCICILMVAGASRDTYSVWLRATNWDSNLKSNICSMKIDSAGTFRGTEILYFPLKVGVTDGESRAWIKADYDSLLRDDLVSKRLGCQQSIGNGI